MTDICVQQHLLAVQKRILEAAERSNRTKDSVRLLAVSKTQPVAAIQEAYQCGQRRFAENRVQEWQEKAPELPADVEWHIVGRLQTNKVKYLNERVTLIHSLDRLPLLETLNEQGKKRGLLWETLVQVNVAGDSAKAGLEPEEVPDFLSSIGDFPNVHVRGFMTIGALAAGSEETRGFFRQLRELRDRLKSRRFVGVNLEELSMGMSRDFETAVEEGATFVRVGREIFGERN